MIVTVINDSLSPSQKILADIDCIAQYIADIKNLVKQENIVDIEKPQQTDSGVETLDQSAMVDTRTAPERDPNNG